MKEFRVLELKINLGILIFRNDESMEKMNCKWKKR